jgi:hypothetical protein
MLVGSSFLLSLLETAGKLMPFSVRLSMYLNRYEGFLQSLLDLSTQSNMCKNRKWQQLH